MVARYVLKRLGRLRVACAALVLATASIVLLGAGSGTKSAGPSLKLGISSPRVDEYTVVSANVEGELQSEKDVIKILFVLCRAENESDQLFSISRQLAQTNTLLKSAVYLSTMHIRFYVVCSSPEIYEQVLALTYTWPPQMLRKVDFKYLPTWFPPHMHHVREMFRPCSSQRLFIDHLLPTEDAVIYMDTDFIFLRSPDLLWEEFQNFNSTHMVSAAMPTLMVRDDPETSKIIDFSSVGFNAGVLLLNLTRLRSFPGGYQSTVLRAITEHSDIILQDQDALNFIFNKNPQYFRELSCTWNFRWALCRYIRQNCAQLLTLGAYAVHGLGGAFLSELHPKMEEFHTQWYRLNLSEPLHEFARTLEASLVKKTGPSYCSLLKSIEQILLQQLKTRLLQHTL